jgi:methionyl aminopeptidase
MKVARKAIQEAAKKAVVGNKVGDLGYTMQSIVEEAGFSVAKEFVGHGIGRGLHDEPQIPAWGIRNSGRYLEEGMVLCVEAQVMASRSDRLYIDDDGWTVKSDDGAKAAMFEYMVVVKKGKPIFLTPTMDWPLF